MRILVITTLAISIAAGCGAQQGSGTTTAPATAGPETRQQAIDDVLQLATTNCQDGIHGSLDHVAADGPLLIVGTAGEVIEGRPSLEEVNQSYTTRNVVVRHECDGVHRMAYASANADVVWVEEALRTHASWPGFSVDFPSQRTMIFEQMPQGWQLRYYSLSVRLPDDQLDLAYAQPAETPAEPAAAPAETTAPPEEAPEE